MKFMLSTGFNQKETEIPVKTTERKKGEEVSCRRRLCIVSVGRKPYTEGLGLENAGVELDERGRVKSKRSFTEQWPIFMQLVM